MNWGYKIAIVIVIFIVGMLGMVYVANMQTNEMIDENYYDKEIKYQNLINAAKNFNAIANKDSVAVVSGNILTVRFPNGTCDTGTKGNVELLKIDNKKHDIRQTLICNEAGNAISIINGGLYKARVYWEHNNRPYYFEKNILIAQ